MVTATATSMNWNNVWRGILREKGWTALLAVLFALTKNRNNASVRIVLAVSSWIWNAMICATNSDVPTPELAMARKDIAIPDSQKKIAD